jgi:hypothetical protein
VNDYCYWGFNRYTRDFKRVHSWPGQVKTKTGFKHRTARQARFKARHAG